MVKKGEEGELDRRRVDLMEESNEQN